jgi:hypothetical protein
MVVVPMPATTATTTTTTTISQYRLTTESQWLALQEA